MFVESVVRASLSAVDWSTMACATAEDSASRSVFSVWPCRTSRASKAVDSASRADSADVRTLLTAALTRTVAWVGWGYGRCEWDVGEGVWLALFHISTLVYVCVIECVTECVHARLC